MTGGPTTTVAPEAPITKKRSPRRRSVIPAGWVARGFTFEVTWPADPGAAAKIHSHFGARRFAYNRALAQVKADLDAKKADPAHVSVPWNLYAIRKQFNAEKHAIAPWWEENSKEAYATGIADLCVALENWSDSRSGKRVGSKVGFPRFRSKRKGHARVRFTTGAMRVEPDRRTITLPVVGTLRSKESTRGLERLVATGRGRILSATLSEWWDDSSSRRIPGSNGHRAAKAKLARLDRRTVHLRRVSAHQLTSWLADTYAEVVIEDLDLAAMTRTPSRASPPKSPTCALPWRPWPTASVVTRSSCGGSPVAGRPIEKRRRPSRRRLWPD